MLKVYVDTCVYLNYFNKETDKLRPLDSFAFDFFSRGWNCHFMLVVSDLVFEELRGKVSDKDISELLSNFKEKNKLIIVHYDEKDVSKSKRLSKEWKDALHTIIASREKCDFLVTRNIKHFGTFSSMIDISHPES